MTKILKFIFFIFLPMNFYSQASINLKRDAEKMGASFIMEDYITFSKYNHPKIIKMMGGELKMQELLQQTVLELRSQGFIFSGISFGEPGKITKLKNELVGTVYQTTIMQTPKGKSSKTTRLLAFSYDEGKHWYFSDTSNKNFVAIKKLFPEVTSEMLKN